MKGYSSARFIGLLLIPLIPIGVLAGLALSGRLNLPAELLIALGGVFYLLVLIAGLSGALSEPDPEMTQASIKDRGANLGLDLVNEIKPIGMASEIRTAAASGRCPLVFGQGSAWRIGQDGKLDRPVCRSGASAFERLMAESAASPVGTRPWQDPAWSGIRNPASAIEVRCDCPLGPQKLFFKRQAA
ncbi:MAG: hypothetical protein HY678_06345 [Chloroflexi bacterium]|nr:hypothetical protein [Chloroflexota bacterium]